MKRLAAATPLLISILFPLNAFASCQNAPSPGLMIIAADKNNAARIMITSEVALRSNNPEAVNFAFKKARAKAKSVLAEEIGKIVRSKKSMKELRIPEEIIKKEYAKSGIFGITELGSCLTPGQIVRVSFRKEFL